MTLIPSLALASRRFHDIGKSGWWQILPLGGLAGWIILNVFEGLVLLMFNVPSFMLALVDLPRTLLLLLFPGSIVLLIVWLAKKGDEGPNKYGPDPIQPT